MKSVFQALTIVFFFLIGIKASFAQGYLHRSGQKILDGQGQNVLLRGLGLGGWMVQEGYMLKTTPAAGPQHVIKQKITELIGKENTRTFYDAYLKNGVTERDIDSLAAWGFNSVRLPMHYNLYTPPIEDEKNGDNTWLEKGFTMTDSVLKWCAKNKMYLILDLHAAPGGQGKDSNISDYDDSKPSLWESAANRDKMVALWKKIATRYKDEPWVGAYDIINEPNWNFTGTNKNGCDETSNAPLRKLMVDITKGIREIDNNHLIFIEGNCWGNNYMGIFPLWDDNLALSFHKYWNHNTQASIQQMLDYRTKYNVPIWLGESGENSNVWFKNAISLMEKNNIGWAFWPMKKIENIAGVTSVTENAGYRKILDYWNKNGKKPSETEAFQTLMQLANNYQMQNLTVKRDVIDAMFRQVHTDSTLAYAKNTVPGTIYATDYDLGSNGFAYNDTSYANYRTDTGNSERWNTGNVLRNDGVDITTSADPKGNGYAVFDIKKGEWLQFTINAEKAGNYTLALRYANASETGILHLEKNGKKLGKTLDLPKTGSEPKYKTIALSGIPLEKGENKIRVVFDQGGFVLGDLRFSIPD